MPPANSDDEQAMEVAEFSSETKKFAYQGGAIKRLHLLNFMCHEKFELDLGPRVNFIIGPNGSGKSALLTALVVVLGGRATTTSRAKRVSEFVQEGKKFARITCVIHNYDKVMERDQAFKPDEFGKEIIVEKTIYKDEMGGTKLVLKDDKMRKVSERKQMLDDILEHFRMLINNPICILNQEVSKSFLHSKRPEDKFELFMRATNLIQIESDYDEAKEAYGDWDNINVKKSLGFRLLDKEYAECKEKTNFLNNRLKLQDRAEELSMEMLWATLRDQESEVKSLEADIESFQAEISKSEADIEKREAASNAAESEIEQFKENIKETQENTKGIKQKLEEYRAKEMVMRPKLLHVKHAIDGGTSKLDRLQTNKTQLENKIKRIRTELGNQSSQADEETRRKLELERLEYEVSVEKSSEQGKRDFCAQLNSSMMEVRCEVSRANQQISQLKQDLTSKQYLVRRMIGGRESELRKYGEHVVRICAAIDKDEGNFQHKPRGPLGLFIKLRTPKIAKALEVHLGKNAHAFTVDNTQDLMKLKAIIRRVKASSSHEFREPLIITRKFKQKHDVSRYKASSENYKTLLDLVDIQDENVYNAIVDRTFLEQVLFIEDYFEAQNVMLTPASVPKGTRCAYTGNGDVMFPRTNRHGFKTVANNRKNMCLFSTGNEEQIQELELQISDLEKRIAIADTEVRRIQASYEEQRREYDTTLNELRTITEQLKEKEMKLFALKTAIPVAQPQELLDLETDLSDMMEQIRDTKVNVEKEKLNLESLNTDLAELEQKKKLQLTSQKQIEREIHKIEEAINQRKEMMSNNRLAISKIKMNMEKSKREQAENTKKLEKMNSDLDIANQNLVNKERPCVVRRTSVIHSEQEQVARQLRVEIDENQDPAELLENYRKRMEEIAKTVELKEHNRSNYELAGKSLKYREEGVTVLRNHTCGSVSSTFASVMRAMDMEGRLSIHVKDHVVNGQLVAKARTLVMSIDTSASQRPSTLSTSDRNAETPATDRRSSRSQQNHADAPASKRARYVLSPSEKENQRMTDTRSLSGGERSFSTVAFVLALWHHCASPFKLMDEIDVFMDMVTRRMSYNALIKFAEATENPGQFIYFSPLQLPEIDATKGLVKVLAMPNIIRRGQSQAPPPADDDE